MISAPPNRAIAILFSIGLVSDSGKCKASAKLARDRKLLYAKRVYPCRAEVRRDKAATFHRHTGSIRADSAGRRSLPALIAAGDLMQHLLRLLCRETLHLRRVIHRTEFRPAHGAEGSFLETLFRQGFVMHGPGGLRIER